MNSKIPETADSPGVDVRPLMAAIRRRARQASLREEEALRLARKSVSGELLTRVSRLHSRVATLRGTVGRVGDLPPQPPTLRGRAGVLPVRLVRRALFWLIPPLQAMQEQMAQVLEEQAAVNAELVKALEQANLRIEVLRRQVEASGGRE
jgi:hypothetical protein